MKIFFSAGETSGDLHGAQIIRQLRLQSPTPVQIQMMGGDRMAKAAGVKPLIHCSTMAFMGFSEVLRNLGTVRRSLKTIKEYIVKEKPDCVVLIDYPSFNLKIAKMAKARGIRVVWYISPKVWAWKSWRVKSLKKNVDQMLTILPFETSFYKRYGMDVDYVGNPTVEEIDKVRPMLLTREEFYAEHKLRLRRQCIALLPGSRRSEIKNNLPVMEQAANQFPEYIPIIAGAPGIPVEYYRQFSKAMVVYDQGFSILANSRAALVTSGTATLETALLNTPQVVCYHGNGSKLTYSIMSKILKVRFVSLPNLIYTDNTQDKDAVGIIPELLMQYCNPTMVADLLFQLLPDTLQRQHQLEGYKKLAEILGHKDTAKNAARLILEGLGYKPKEDKPKEEHRDLGKEENEGQSKEENEDKPEDESKKQSE